MNQDIKVQVSSGNVFADLGLENSDELLVKAEFARKISSIITKQEMTQAEAAELLNIDQPKVSALMNGKLSGFSTVQLFHFLTLFCHSRKTINSSAVEALFSPIHPSSTQRMLRPLAIL